MRARFSLFHFSSYYLCLLLVVALFHLCSSNRKLNEVLCLDDERQALVEFKNGLIDETDRLASWDAGEESDCCRWSGIGCDNSTGHVHRIHLPGLDDHFHDSDYVFYEESGEASKQRLKGYLSPSLLYLKQLRHLDLSCDDFGWTEIPKFIASFKNLRYLNISLSNFSGMIPPQLGNLSELHVLSLGSFHESSNFELTSISNMQWLSSLRKLHHLDMSGVDLSKASDCVQVINTLPSLIELHLFGSYLSDIHPHFPSLNLTSLSVLDLSHNYFNSSMAPWIFGITSLVSLDLSLCRFHDLIPASGIDRSRNLTSLELLRVNGNNFMNSPLVFKGLSSIASNLVSLDISSCGVSSSVLDSLQNLTSLRTLDLSFNLLTRALPKSLGNVCNLRKINLGYNFFSNITLTSLLEIFYKCKSPRLESFSLESSELYGRLSGQLGQLINLMHLNLSSNNIAGIIPDSIGQLSSLKTLFLDGNLISGHIPYSIGRLSSLEELYLSHNQLDGTLPDSIGELSSLKVLYLSKNRLNGSLPVSLGQLSKLEELSFSLNLMTGVVTESHFAKLVSLMSRGAHSAPNKFIGARKVLEI